MKTRNFCLVLSISLLAGVPAAPAQPSFAGAWETSFGLMNLTQEASAVQGFYLMEGGRCTIQGKLEGSRLNFTYQEPTAAGEGQFELAADGQSFTGKWRQSDRGTWQPWIGNRVKPASTDTFAGLWDTSFGRMRLVQAGEGLEGTYSYTGGSIIAGKQEGRRFVFHYREPAAGGEGWFELSDGGRAFAGQWKADGASEWDAWSGTRVDPVPGRVWLVVIEANWEGSLAEQEYSYGSMLRAFFARSSEVVVRHRFFTDDESLRRWCQDVAYLAEPVVLVIPTHGSTEGISVNGQTIGAKIIADSLRHAVNLRLLHFSACEILKDRVAADIVNELGTRANCPVSGYTTSVDWAASVILEFTYLELILCRGMSPADAAAQVRKLLTFAGDDAPPDSAFPAAGFQLLAPRGGT